MSFIDCDSHVIETEQTWDHLRPEEQRFRPQRFEFPQVESAVPGSKAAWNFADTWASYLPGDNNRTDRGNIFDPESTQLSSLEKRLADLDALGIDRQLVFSSVFIGVEMDNPLEEIALTRSYNRWMADQVGGCDRLPWAMKVPTRSIPEALEELEFGKAHGATGVHVRGVEHDLLLSDPFFYPLYERAEELDLSMLIHVGAAVRSLPTQRIGTLLTDFAQFMPQVGPLMQGFHAVINEDLHLRFPRLRWGFIEGGATWIPAVLQQHARLVASARVLLDLEPITPDVLEAKNIFVACEADEHLDYLVGVVGENVLCIGTDYAHNDLGSELGAHTAILDRTDISETVKHKIVSTNGRRLLGMPADAELTADDFRRADSPPNVVGASTVDGRPILTTAR